MVQFVRNNRILLSQKRFEQTPICVKTRRIQKSILRPQKIRKCLFQLLMHLVGPQINLTLAIPYPHLSSASLAASTTSGCCAKPEVVIGAKIQNRFSIGNAYGRSLRCNDDPLLFVGAGAANRR